MRPVTMAFALFCLGALGGCIGLKSGGEGVFEPTSVQPPPSERGSAPVATQPAVAPPAASDRRTLNVPNR